MEIPKTLKVLSREYEVVQEKTTNDSHYAMALHKNLKIALYSSDDYKMPESIEAAVFLHEIIHCIETAFELDLEEKTVERLAGGLLAVIRDNDLDFRKKI